MIDLIIFYIVILLNMLVVLYSVSCLPVLCIALHLREERSLISLKPGRSGTDLDHYS